MAESKSVMTAAVAVGLLLGLPLRAQEAPRDEARYVPKRTDPVLKEMEELNKQLDKNREAETDRIRNAQEELKEKEKDEEREVRFDFSTVEKPASVDIFQSAIHFPPVRQFLTGNCWCFSTTSFFESELHRLTGRSIKLSEMFTVYHEYLEKARRYVQRRGDSFFGSGSEGNAVIMVWRKYGVVPADQYKGELDPDGRYDETEMVAEMKAYLDHILKGNTWDEESVTAHLRLIMDKYMGKPPDRFTHDGATMTPRQFLTDVLKFRLDDYVSVMSTLSQPFHAYGTYDVEGNWWRSDEYYNVPLDEFMGIVKYAVRGGYTVRINGDVSEPGYSGPEDVAIVPSFDIPAGHIDQSAREFRFANETTTDDHDIHLVGYTTVGDRDWFLIKDSASAAQHGKFNGYLFYREDYVRLKMLTFIVHKDAVRAVVGEFR